MEVTLINVGDIIAYGLRCVSSNLKKNGINTKMIFIPPRFADISHKKLFPAIMDIAENSAFIGISLMAGQFKSAVYLTENLKEMRDIPICWGGVHPTVCPDECMRHADAICIGEAEETAVSLAKKMEAGGGLDGIDGVWFKRGGGVAKNRLRDIPEDLDSLPPPDYDFSTHYIFDFDRGKMAPMESRYFFKHRGDRYTTLPTRGCAMNCTYCVNHYLHEMNPRLNKLRAKSVDNLISELKWAKDNLSFVGQINFYDDDFLRLPMEYLRDFVDKYKRYIDMPLVITGVSPHNYNREKLDLIQKNIRIYKWRLGIQSGSERTRREIFNRPHSNEKLFEIIDYFSTLRKKSQINYDIILETPWEEEKDRIETFRFLMRIPKPFRLIVYYLTFYPGTVLYERAKKEGLLNQSNDGFSQMYQKPRSGNRLNRIIASVDKLPKWFLWVLFYTRKIPVISDLFMSAGDVIIAFGESIKQLRTRIGIIKRAIRFA